MFPGCFLNVYYPKHALFEFVFCEANYPIYVFFKNVMWYLLFIVIVCLCNLVIASGSKKNRVHRNKQKHAKSNNLNFCKHFIANLPIYFLDATFNIYIYMYIFLPKHILFLEATPGTTREPFNTQAE